MRLSIFGHTFFWPTLTQFDEILEHQETVIYRLVTRNPSYQAQFSIYIFEPVLPGKFMANTRSLKGLGPHNSAKKGKRGLRSSKSGNFFR